MTLRCDREYPVRLDLGKAAVQEYAAASGLVRLVQPALHLDRAEARLEGRARGRMRSWRFPYRHVIESKARGSAGLFLRLRTGERLFLDVHDRDEWLRVDPLAGMPRTVD